MAAVMPPAWPPPLRYQGLVSCEIQLDRTRQIPCSIETPRILLRAQSKPPEHSPDDLKMFGINNADDATMRQEVEGAAYCFGSCAEMGRKVRPTDR